MIETLIALTIALKGLSVALAAQPVQTPINEVVVTEVKEVKEEKVDPRIQALITCESGGNKEAIGDQGKARGVLQFHKPTFIYFSRKYGVFHPLSTDADILKMYTDTEAQIKLATLILDNEKRGWAHWYTCSLRYGVDKMEKPVISQF